MCAFYSARYFLRIPEYFKFLDTERTGRLTYAKIKDALMTLSRAPPLNIIAHKLIAEKRVGTIDPKWLCPSRGLFWPLVYSCLFIEAA